MYLSTTDQNDTATLVAKWVRGNTIGYGAVATRVGRGHHADAAIVAIASTGETDCTAKVAVYHDRLVYVSATGTHISYPTRWSDAGRIVGAFLLLENN